MTIINSHSVDIEVVAPMLITLPSVFDNEGVITYVSATMRLRYGGTIVCEWVEHDVESALRDLAEKVTMKLGPNQRLDIYFGDGGTLRAVAWEGTDAERQAGSLKTTEETFFNAVAAAGTCVEAWKRDQPQLGKPASTAQNNPM